jgi:hypothetical protein
VEPPPAPPSDLPPDPLQSRKRTPSGRSPTQIPPSAHPYKRLRITMKHNQTTKRPLISPDHPRKRHNHNNNLTPHNNQSTTQILSIPPSSPSSGSFSG